LAIDGQLTSVQGPGGPQITRIGKPVINSIGQPIGAFYGKVANGYYPSAVDAAAHLTNAAGTCGTPPCQPGAVVGGLRYVDINGDGKIDANDRTILGSPHPDSTADLAMRVPMGAWGLRAALVGSFGAELCDGPAEFDLVRACSPYLRTGGPTNYLS